MMKRKRTSSISLVAIMILAGFSLLISPDGFAEGTDTLAIEVKERHDQADQHFIMNEGQLSNGDIVFYSNGGNIFFSMDSFFLKITDTISTPDTDLGFGYHENGVMLKYTFGGRHADPIGEDRSQTIYNYFIGNDPNKWHTEVTSYQKIIYHDLWEGIDIQFYLNEGNLKYDIIVSPGADPEMIRIEIDGHESLSVDSNGDLLISTEKNVIRDRGLLAFQDNGEIVPCAFNIIDQGTFNFNLKDYDQTRDLIIDPVLDFSTLIGGSGSDTVEGGITSDQQGNIYITGSTMDSTTGFPNTTGSYDITHNGKKDVFISKLDPTGSSLLFSTYIGGDENDDGWDICLDGNGAIFVTGQTREGTVKFPTTTGAYDTTYNGEIDIFLLKLNTMGSSLLFSTLIGGDDTEYVRGLFVDTSGYPYITGSTNDGDVDYPTTTGAYDTSQNGKRDVYLTKFSKDGASLQFSTLIGGEGLDYGNGLHVDSNGNSYIIGSTDNVTIAFPTTNGAYDTTLNGGWDVFVCKIDPTGSNLLRSTYVGGSGWDVGKSICVDNGGNIYITGYAGDGVTDYPTTPGAFDTSANGMDDVFVNKLDNNLSSLQYSTFLGSGFGDTGTDICVDIFGNAYVTGFASPHSNAFPTTSGAYSSTHNGVIDGFFTKIDSTGSSLLYSTFLGGSEIDSGVGLSMGADGNIYILGFTDDGSVDYPTTTGAYSTRHSGSYDVFITAFTFDLIAPSFISDDSDQEAYTGDTFKFSTTVIDSSGIDDVILEYRIDNGIQINLSMDGSGPYTKSLTIPSDATGLIQYSFRAYDTEGNWNLSQIRSIPIIDNDPPLILDEGSDIFATTGDFFKIGISVEDNIHVDEVAVKYWFGDEEELAENITLSLDEDVWSSTIEIPHKVVPLKYIFSAGDDEGNWMSSEIHQKMVIDNDAPNSHPGADTEISAGDTIHLNGSISSDNIAIVEYQWSFNYNGNPVQLNGPEQSYHFDIPGSYRIYLKVIDGASLEDEKFFNLTVFEKSIPEIRILNTDLSVDHRDPYVLSVEVLNITEVVDIRLSYMDLEGQEINSTMELIQGDIWGITIPPQNCGGEIEFDILVLDGLDTWRSTGPITLIVVDDLAPTITLSYNEYVLVEEDIIIEVTANDLSGIGSARIYYTDMTGTESNQSMVFNDPVYTFTIPGQETTGDILFEIIIIDKMGNQNGTGELTISVFSFPGPVKSDPGLNISARVGEFVGLDGSSSSGNGEIVNYTWSFEYDGAEMVLYGAKPGFVFNEPGIYVITLTVEDTFGLTDISTVTVTITEEDILLIGPIRDENGDKVAGAKVKLIFEGETLEEVTGADGIARFLDSSNLRGRTVKLEVSKEGYSTYSKMVMINEDLTISDTIPSLEVENLEESDDLPIGLIVAISIILLLLIIGMVVFFLLKKGKNVDEADQIEEMSASIEDTGESVEGGEQNGIPSQQEDSDIDIYASEQYNDETEGQFSESKQPLEQYQEPPMEGEEITGIDPNVEEQEADQSMSRDPDVPSQEMSSI